MTRVPLGIAATKKDELQRRLPVSCQQKRLILALAIVSLLFVATVGFSGIEAGLCNQPVAEQVLFDSLKEEDSFYSSIVAFAEGTKLKEEVPDEVAGDLSVPCNAREVIVDKQGNSGIVSYVTPYQIDEAWNEVCDCFDKANWVRKESGTGYQGVFFRTSGLCRWVFISCVDVGNKTTVVMQYQLTQGGV